MPHTAITMLLVFMVGALCALGAAFFFANPKNLKVLGDNSGYTETDSALRNTVQNQEEKHLSTLKKGLFENLLPSIAASPLFTPILQTKEEVEKTTDTIKALPQDQRTAICKQICSQ